MRVDIDTSIGTFENIERFSITQGQKFVFRIADGYGIENPVPRWASFNDPVLNIVDSGMQANVEATKPGDAEIWLVNGDSILKKLFIAVTVPTKEAVSTKTVITEEKLKS